jgi:hypothetical protein
MMPFVISAFKPACSTTRSGRIGDEDVANELDIVVAKTLPQQHRAIASRAVI